MIHHLMNNNILNYHFRESRSQFSASQNSIYNYIPLFINLFLHYKLSQLFNKS